MLHFLPVPDISSPIGLTWELEDNRPQPMGMTQPATPVYLIELVKCGCISRHKKKCRCKKASLACIDSSIKTGEDISQNPYKHFGSDDEDDDDEECD